MKVAACAYPLDWLENWDAFETKTTALVTQAAENGADLLVFPEYGLMELSTLQGKTVAGDLEASLHAVSQMTSQAVTLYGALATQFGVHILAPSGPAFDTDCHPTRPMNRAHLIAPNGKIGIQDKQIMTLFERDPWDIAPGGDLQLFETAIGKIGVLICYDSEFPLLGRALAQAGAEIILVPSCTEALAGYWRVRIGAMSRALEGQCVSVMCSLVGAAEWSQAIEQNTGTGGIFGPPDTGFPATGVIAEGELNAPGWTYAEIDLAQIAHVRAKGIVRNKTHWDERAPDGRLPSVTVCDLR